MLQVRFVFTFWNFHRIFLFKVKLSNTKTFLLACPGNQVRFGDHCYEEASQIFSLVSDNDDVLKNADACATVGGVLWYPETVEEIKWVAHNFPLASGDLYHLGYKNYSQNFGIYAINGQFIAGIPFYTRK